MIALYYADSHDSTSHEPTHLIDLPTAYTELHTRYAGTRAYRAGIVSTAWPLLQDTEIGTGCWQLWVRIDDDYLRVHNITPNQFGTVVLEVDQSFPAPAARTAADGTTAVQLRVIEPSPPRPVAEWLPAEAERVIRDYETQLAVAAEINELFAELPSED